MAVISIENMSFYAYHGCFSEEQKIGTHFRASIEFETDTHKAEISDNIEDTVDYSKVYLAIKDEILKPSHLLEHVARRVIDRLKKDFPNISRIKFSLSKLNPPVGGQMDCISVTILD